ncbi:MAG: hypothetical protein ACQEUZ_13655 [Pseudomonadota bacterium]
MRKLLFWLILLAILVGPVAFVLAAFEPEPALPRSAALSPQQAQQSKALVKRIRAALGGAEPDRATGEITASRREIDGLIAAGARVVSGLRGQSEIRPDGLGVTVSAQAPGLPQLGWINLRAEAAASDQGLELRALRLGRMDLPPGLGLAALRLGADALLQGQPGTLLVHSVRAVEPQGERVTLRLDPSGADGESLFDSVVASVRNAAGMSDGATVREHYEAMAQAAREGRLPDRGSVAPWLAFAAERAAEGPGERAAALLALAAHCGDRSAVGTAVGGFDAPQGQSACAGLTLAGRRDLRKHFILSAGFQAAGGSAVSFGMGEVKELVDASGGGSGFSFDDIAADRAGIRWAEAIADADPEALAEIARKSGEETVLMPAIDDLPSFMQEAEFRDRYGRVDSPRYKAQLAEIDARIDALPLYR